MSFLRFRTQNQHCHGARADSVQPKQKHWNIARSVAVKRQLICILSITAFFNWVRLSVQFNSANFTYTWERLNRCCVFFPLLRGVFREECEEFGCSRGVRLCCVSQVRSGLRSGSRPASAGMCWSGRRESTGHSIFLWACVDELGFYPSVDIGWNFSSSFTWAYLLKMRYCTFKYDWLTLTSAGQVGENNRYLTVSYKSLKTAVLWATRLLIGVICICWRSRPTLFQFILEFLVKKLHYPWFCKETSTNQRMANCSKRTLLSYLYVFFCYKLEECYQQGLCFIFLHRF